MEFSAYFSPIERGESDLLEGMLGEIMSVHTADDGFPETDGAAIALIGIPESRGAAGNEGCANGPDAIRQHLHRLYPGDVTSSKMVDLGNIIPGETLLDTNYAISFVVTELVKRNTVPVILGGSHDLTYGVYQAYEQLEQVVNLLTIDQKIDLGEPGDEMSVHTYLSKIVLKQPNYLFNYCNIGYQTYFVGGKAVELVNQLYFDAVRLGEARANMQETEPPIRDADVVSIDIAAVRHSDAPGTAFSGPNGFAGEELCQMSRYAGYSDKLSAFGIFGVNPDLDPRDQTAQLAAQAIWCFIDGFGQRKKDIPGRRKKDFVKYRVAIKGQENELVFFKSLKTDRWWMDVPYAAGKQNRYQRHQLVPCSYSDYQLACEDEVPDKWWRTYQKLSAY